MSSFKIPQNIFQTWSTKNISDGFKKLTESWIIKNPHYTYCLYDDSDCEEFIKNNFDENIYNTYCRIIPGAFKADLWRYCVLYIYGGIYVDIDTFCLESIDLFLNQDVEFMTPVDLNNCPSFGTYNLFNCFIASIPKHPILLDCINRIAYNVENNIIPFSNLDFSGPGVLGKSTNKFLNLPEETSFVGKEGELQNIKLLKFWHGTEYVSDINNNILFQNKNGSAVIKQIYENEAKNTNNICWGTCKNPIKDKVVITKNNVNPTMTGPTIVTMFYNIRDKEKNLSDTPLNHSVNRYIEFAKKFMLTLPYNLLIFTDDDELIKYLTNIRNDNKNASKTFICKKKFEDTYYYKHLDVLGDLQQRFNIINGHLEHETPMYVILNNNKFDFIESAIRLNPFNSSHFIWMDFGINHVAQNTEYIHEWISRVPDKIKQLCINPFTENVPNKEHFKFIYHNMAGGLFSGSAENLLKYCNLFKQKTEEIYSDNWYQIDEAVMTMVQRENPHLFDLYYGDYPGIISNYSSPIHNIELILNGSQKYIKFNKTKEAHIILCYCLKYFENNPDSRFLHYFIQQNIIVNYYNNDKLLLEGVINLCNLKLTSNNQDEKKQMHTILMNNKVNIDYYKNKELIHI